MELAGRSLIYKRSQISETSPWVLVVETLAQSAPLATLLEVSFLDPKITLLALYKVRPGHLPASLIPNF